MTGAAPLGPWTHQSGRDEPVSVAAMAEQLDMDPGEVRNRAVVWAGNAVLRGSADAVPYADEEGDLLTPAAASAVWGQFY